MRLKSALPSHIILLHFCSFLINAFNYFLLQVSLAICGFTVNGFDQFFGTKIWRLRHIPLVIHELPSICTMKLHMSIMLNAQNKQINKKSVCTVSTKQLSELKTINELQE